MISVDIVIPTRNRVSSKSLIEAVQPDNLNMKGLVVKGKPSDHHASFRLEFDGKIETFIFTLDDLLRCLQAAKETLEKVSN
jgi:hypothetical protein